MTNRNRNQLKNTKIQNNNVREKERNFNMSELLSMAISALALIVSGVALFSSIYFATKEYEYKVNPQIEISGVPEVMVYSSDGDEPAPFMDKVYVDIVEKNNLACAYVIYADDKVEKLVPEDMENTITDRMESSMDKKPNVTTEKYEYRYFFLYLESLAGDSKVYLVYCKSSSEIMQFNCISGVEVYGLDKAVYENEKDYEGERIMAQKYVEILKELPNYIKN